MSRRLIKKLRTASTDLYIYRKTRSDIRVSADRLEAVLDAWTDAGPMPDYHEHMKNKLRREWPTLAEALDKLTQ